MLVWTGYGEGETQDIEFSVLLDSVEDPESDHIALHTPGACEEVAITMQA